jgi:SAM-dependent methyltransferase
MPAVAYCNPHDLRYTASTGGERRVARRQSSEQRIEWRSINMSVFYETVARYYDAEIGDRTDDLVLYSQLAEEYGSPIFDVGCGTGRVLLHLAQEGYQVHGIDNSKAMLARLKNKLQAVPFLKEHVSFTEGDVLKMKPDPRYKLVLLTYNALMHFHSQDVQIQLLQRLRGITAPDGLLVIDLPNAGEVFAAPNSAAIILDRKFIEPESGNLVMLQAVSHLDRTTQLEEVTWIYDEISEDGTVRRLFAPHVLRYFFLPELTLLLERTGYQVQDVFGNTDEDPFVDGSERMIIYARPV